MFYKNKFFNNFVSVFGLVSENGVIYSCKFICESQKLKVRAARFPINASFLSTKYKKIWIRFNRFNYLLAREIVS